ncbi:hypothetical protein AB205_0180400, partial [Aquarana catesbeiana]
VHGKCVCQHNTDGLNCEKCKEFYNDAPWSPAVGFEDNACRQCNCNGHSDKCHFEIKVYEASNDTSGGVCDNCQHNTLGNHCEFCKPYFYHDPLKDTSDPNTCIPCDCDPDGTHGGGICEGHTNRRLAIIAGTCLCKQNVEGKRCDQCKPGYFGLSATNFFGCQYNNSPGYWGLGNSLHPCSACNCDIGGARSVVCSQSTGQCDCLPNIVGLQCKQPADGYYFIPLDYYIYEAEKAQALSGSATIDSLFFIHVYIFIEANGLAYYMTKTNTGISWSPLAESERYTLDVVDCFCGTKCLPQNRKYNTFCEC